MSKPDYTPGPWVRAVAVSAETELSHAVIFTEKSLHAHGAHFPLMVFDHQGTPSEAIANLICAAPELYEALCAIVEQYHGKGFVGISTILPAERAIDKAEGRA